MANAPPGGAGHTAEVFDPNTGQVQSLVPMGSKSEVDAAVASAAQAQKEWAAFNPQRRARVMMRFVGLVNEHVDELWSRCYLQGPTVVITACRAKRAAFTCKLQL
jgi:acyl-CoA reductase-like NAD-dependent aldehyde dehydrogenase